MTSLMSDDCQYLLLAYNYDQEKYAGPPHAVSRSTVDQMFGKKWTLISPQCFIRCNGLGTYVYLVSLGILLVHLAFSGGKCLVSKVDTMNILQDKHKARGMDWFEEDLYVITPKT